MPAPSDCQLCPLHKYGTNVVNAIAIGDNPEVMVIGEGPGIQEDRQGIPFTGPTGAILKQELHRRGITRYILSNATRCYPGETKKDAELSLAVTACKPYLLDDIKHYKPKVILAVGAPAVRALGITDPINTIIGQLVCGPLETPVIPSYHPAAYMRDPGSIHMFELAVYKLMRYINNMGMGEEWHPEEKELWKYAWPSRVTIDTETSSKNPRIAELVCITATTDDGTAYIKPGNSSGIDWIRQIWVDPQVEKGFQNGDYDIQVLERYFGERVNGYAWDTMLAEHLLHEEGHYNLETLRGIYTGQPVYERPIRLWKEEEIEIPVVRLKKPTKKDVKAGITEEYEVTTFKKQKRGKDLDGYDTVPEEILKPYAIYDSQTEHMIWRKQEQLFTPKQKELLQDVILPYQLALMDMEREGIKVDVDRIPEMRAFYVQKLDELKEQIYEAADEEFKISSPLEVKRILFEELGLPKPPVRSKTTGEVSTGKKALDWLTQHASHPLIEPLIEYRATDQMLKNFLGRDEHSAKGLMAQIDDGRLYTTFRLTLETGRNSSSPNLQNLPALSKGPIRELPIADRGNLLLQADYSQIELRIAAYESNETTLIKMLETGGDVHTYFGRRLYPFEPDLSDAQWKKAYDAYRTLAKRFTFGRLFGQGEQGMALTFNIPVEEAHRFQAVYTELFPGMDAWWKETIATIRRGEPLETKWGRQRRFPGYAKFANIQWKAKAGLFGHMDREGLNFIPQGSAADTLAKATGNIRAKIIRYNLPINLRLVVHDSLTIECPESYLDTAARFLKCEMEEVGLRFGWKLPVEIKYGRTWAGEYGEYKI